MLIQNNNGTSINIKNTQIYNSAHYGILAQNGKIVAVHYSGALENGKVFDNSYARKKPIEFPLGQGNVIEGWDEGIALLQVGDKARFVIPSYLGYGASGAGGVIPPNATLVFDVELMDVK